MGGENLSMVGVKMANTIDLTDAEATLLNTLYAIMVAGANDQRDAAEGSYNLLKKIQKKMTDAEMLALNKKMSSIIMPVSEEYLATLGIEKKGYSLTELEKKYGEMFDGAPAPSRSPWN